MANVTSASPHGTKRRADDNLDNEQRLSKRFDLLNLDHNGRLWATAPGQEESTNERPHIHKSDDYMYIEDTRDRIFVHNLDEELAEIPDEESKMIFLPDIEKHFSQIPKHVLMGDQSQQLKGHEIILYTVPTSLSVPPEQDSVRKAIIETRARARERASQDKGVTASREALLHDEMLLEASPNYDQSSVVGAGYADPMEIE